MRLPRRRSTAEDDRALLAAARAGDEDALALLRAGLHGEALATAREALRVREPAALRAALSSSAGVAVLSGLGLGRRARAELLAASPVPACRASALLAGGTSAPERVAAAAHAASCRDCR